MMEPTFVGIETTSYSGATLLSFLLNAHPRIATIGEMDGLILKNPEQYTCSCGQPIQQCEFWQAMTREMAARGFDFDLHDFRNEFILGGPEFLQRLRAGSFGNRTLDSIRDLALRTLPGERRQFQQLVARNMAFVASALKITGKTIFVDTSKDHLRARALKMLSPYDVRVIHLVRDPRGVTASKLRRGSKLDARNTARQWVRLHTRLQKGLGAEMGSKYIRVRYEDLCREPRAVLKSLYAFCGADAEFEPSDFKSSPHHVVGNPMRLEKMSVIKLDERWRELLTAEQQQVVWHVAGKLGAQYGYTG
ncbi:MAG: sulfotransferase [Chloroflexi bacterium]|nr:sulfotransferase [Chloroflexota bacterium]